MEATQTTITAPKWVEENKAIKREFKLCVKELENPQLTAAHVELLAMLAESRVSYHSHAIAQFNEALAEDIRIRHTIQAGKLKDDIRKTVALLHSLTKPTVAETQKDKVQEDLEADIAKVGE